MSLKCNTSSMVVHRYDYKKCESVIRTRSLRHTSPQSYPRLCAGHPTHHPRSRPATQMNLLTIPAQYRRSCYRMPPSSDIAFWACAMSSLAASSSSTSSCTKQQDGEKHVLPR